MAWATRAIDHLPVHVQTLGRKQTGLACGCVCPGCGAPVEAVNAGQDAAHFLKPNSHGMSFRHKAGNQRGDCMALAARAALMHQWVSQDFIELPAVKATSFLRGVSGRRYSANVSGETGLVQVVERRWLNSQSAEVTLADGRVIHIQIRSIVSVAPGADAVLTLEIDHPALAGMEPEELLASTRLIGDSSCWESHPDLERIQALAEKAVKQQGADALDAIEPDMDPTFDLSLLDGMTAVQRGETALHLALKRILERADSIRVAGAVFEVDCGLKGGRAVVPLRIPSCSFELSDVRLEQHLGNIVPDVLCSASEFDREFDDSELMIEVAVTHRVDAAKLAKIRERGAACLELDAQRLYGSGRMNHAELEELVHSSPNAFRWVYHPEIESRIKAVQEAAERKEERRRRLEDLERQAKVRQAQDIQRYADRLSALKFAPLLQKYVSDLRPGLRGELVEPQASAYQQLFLKIKRPELATAEFAHLVWCLDCIRSAGLGHMAHPGFTGIAAILTHKKLLSYAPLMLAAYRAYRPNLTDSEAQELARTRTQVLESLAQAEATYARNPKTDEALRLIFPELSQALGPNAMGTLAGVERQRKILQRQAHEARERKLAEQKRKEEEWLELQRKQLDSLVTPAKARNWTRGGGVAFERWSRYDSVSKSCGRGQFELIRRAYQARESGATPATFIASEKPESAQRVESLLASLDQAFLLA